ncbi:MAG: hypothetical protein AAF649_05505 [Verrucomicrobiota bacterium]
MKRIKVTSGLFALLLILTAAQAQTRDDLALVGEKFREVHNQIHEIQMQATQSDAVKKAQDQFSETMNKAMLQADPEIEEDLKKSNALLEQIRNHPEIDDPRAREMNLELKKMLLDYRFLERKLTPARKEASEAPECKKELENLEKVTLAEMKKIHPEIEDLMNRKEELAARYRELRRVVN